MAFWKKTVLFLLTCILLALFLGGLAYAFFIDSTEDFPGNKKAAPASKKEANTQAVLDKPITILLMGLDDGDPEDGKSPRRSDAMLVASIRPEQRSLQLLSVPRDTRVRIEGHGEDKMGHAFFMGGLVWLYRP